MEVHLNKRRDTDDEIGSKDVESLVETVKDSSIMDLFNLKISLLSSADILVPHIVYFFIEFIEDIFGYDRLKSIDNSIFIFFSSLIIIRVSL